MGRGEEKNEGRCGKENGVGCYKVLGQLELWGLYEWAACGMNEVEG